MLPDKKTVAIAVVAHISKLCEMQREKKNNGKSISSVDIEWPLNSTHNTHTQYYYFASETMK